jgi:hypothetical protein
MVSKTSAQDQDQWTEGMSKLAEAARHNVTASTLVAAGVAALGAAAFAYFWDSERRNSLLDSTRRLSEDMNSFWGRFGAPSINQ